MKRIGIITLHYNCNYGAVLQAYSLQYILEELGYEAYIIDYENPYGKKELTLISNSILQNLRTLFF